MEGEVLRPSQLARNTSDADAYMTARASDGSESRTFYRGTMLATVLEDAGIPEEYLNRVEIPRIGGGVSQVSKTEIIQGFFADPYASGSPRFANIDAFAGDQVRFFRPMRTPSDTNAEDLYTTEGLTASLPLYVYTTNETVRHPEANVVTKNPTAQNPVDFHVEVGSAEGQPYAFSWNFGDGTAFASGPDPSHTFATGGSYRVVVNAYGADNSAGVAVLPDVVVTDKAGATPTATPTATATSTPNGGAGPGGAGTGGAAPTGGGVGDKDAVANGPRKSKGKNDKKSVGKKTGSATATPTSTVTATATATVTATPAGGSSGTGSASASATPGGAPQSSATATGSVDAPDPTATPQAAKPPAALTGEHVEGILLANAGSIEDVIAAARSAEAKATERSQARAGGGGSGSLAGWFGGGGLLFVLLAAGAAREGIFRLR